MARMMLEKCLNDQENCQTMYRRHIRMKKLHVLPMEVHIHQTYRTLFLLDTEER